MPSFFNINKIAKLIVLQGRGRVSPEEPAAGASPRTEESEAFQHPVEYERTKLFPGILSLQSGGIKGMRLAE
jgi:hypothetical protein